MDIKNTKIKLQTMKTISEKNNSPRLGYDVICRHVAHLLEYLFLNQYHHRDHPFTPLKNSSKRKTINNEYTWKTSK